MALPRRRRSLRPPAPTPPDQIERAYVRRLLEIGRRLAQLVDEIVVPRLAAIEGAALMLRPTADADAAVYREDDYADLIRRILELLRVTFYGSFNDAFLQALTRKVADDLATFNRRQTEQTLKAVIGVDVFRSEPWLETEMRAFVTDNVALIKTMSERHFASIERVVFDGARQGLRHEVVRGQLRAIGVSKFKYQAVRIARDQANKFNGQLSMLRQQEAGISRYIWRSVRDARVRQSHAAMEGRVCDWAKPPLLDGVPAHPGWPIQCRCYAEPVLEDALEG